MGRAATRSPGRPPCRSRARSARRSTTASLFPLRRPPVDNCSVGSGGHSSLKRSAGHAEGAQRPLVRASGASRRNLSAMPTNSASERSGEGERSERPQDHCCQVPLCPFPSLPPFTPFHGWSVSGSLEHQAKRLVHPGPVHPRFIRAAGVRVTTFHLVIAPFGCTALLPTVATPYGCLFRSPVRHERVPVRVLSRSVSDDGRSPVHRISHPAAAGASAVARSVLPTPRLRRVRLWRTLWFPHRDSIAVQSSHRL